MSAQIRGTARALQTIFKRAVKAGLTLEQLGLLSQMPCQADALRGSAGGRPGNKALFAARDAHLYINEEGMLRRTEAGDALFASPPPRGERAMHARSATYIDHDRAVTSGADDLNREDEY